MLTCQKASTFIERKAEGDLNFVEGVQLRLHLLACDLCRRYVKQSQRLNEFLSRQKEEVNLESTDLPQFKSELKAKIKSE